MGTRRKSCLRLTLCRLDSLVRVVPLLAYLGLAATLFVRNGIPLAGDRLVAWLVGALLCISIAARSHRWRTLLRGWLPLAGALAAYNVFTGIGGGRVPIRSDPPIWVAEHLFGVVPSVWL